MKEIECILSKMKKYLPYGKVIRIEGKMLEQINPKIFEHTERTAYISYKLASLCEFENPFILSKIVLLSYFHTIGFFREDAFFDYNPHSTLIDYFSGDDSTQSKYVFTRFFLEYKTPIRNLASSIENLNTPNELDVGKTDLQIQIKKIINFSSHLSELIFKKFSRSQIDASLELLLENHIFDRETLKLFEKSNSDNQITKNIQSGFFKQELYDFIDNIKIENCETNELRRFLIYFFDFKSTSTMRHSVNTSCYVISLAERLNLNEEQIAVLFVSAVLHDIGKMSVPTSILESPNRLTNEEMRIMRLHVNNAEFFCRGLISDEIMQNVLSHHEKLNGKGYPNKRTAEELSLPQRILTVADIISALNDSRTYKGEYSKDKTIQILRDMTKNGELDQRITNFVINEFDEICNEQVVYRKNLQVDVSVIFDKYNDYLYQIIKKSSTKQIIPLEPLDDFEDLDELEELEED